MKSASNQVLLTQDYTTDPSGTILSMSYTPTENFGGTYTGELFVSYDPWDGWAEIPEHPTPGSGITKTDGISVNVTPNGTGPDCWTGQRSKKLNLYPIVIDLEISFCMMESKRVIVTFQPLNISVISLPSSTGAIEA